MVHSPQAAHTHRAPAGPVAGWQPIETAPTDGSVVTVAKHGSTTIIPFPWPLSARYIDGRWRMNMGGDKWSSFDPQPTHWRRS